LSLASVPGMTEAQEWTKQQLLDELEACRRRVRAGAHGELRDDVPILLSGGFAEKEVTRRLVGRGTTEFLQKPYSLAGLQSKLRTLLGRR